MPRPSRPNRQPAGRGARDPFAPPTPAQVKIHQIKTRVAPLLSAGQHELAIGLLEDVLPLDRRDPMLHKMLGGAYAGSMNMSKAVFHLRRAAELGLDDADTLLTLASVYKDTGETGASLRIIEKILASDPGEMRAVRFKAFLLRSMGEAEKALDWIDRVHERFGPHPDTTVLRAALLVRFKRFDEGEADLRSVLEDPRSDERHRRDALYDLGALLDKTEREDEAFEAIARSNGMLPEVSVITPEMFRERWTPEAIAAIPVAGDPSDRPVFIVGMPRSGTTLTEQIIAAHPEAMSVGESAVMNELCRDLMPAHLSEEALGRIASVYLEQTAPPQPTSKRAPRISRVVDKMPENYYFLPMIARGLPAASVIHCTRDPRDTGLSCFFQNFGNRLGWTRRLETIGHQHRLYSAIMELWKKTLGIEILESNYEGLTGEPRPNVEALLGHIGLTFDEACMAHHKAKSTVQTASVDQVRNPIYTTSRQRWKRYEKHLGPMIEAMGL